MKLQLFFLLRRVLTLSILTFLVEFSLQSNKQPWPLTIQTIAGPCCDFYFRSNNHDNRQLFECILNNNNNYTKLKKSSILFVSYTNIYHNIDNRTTVYQGNFTFVHTIFFY